MNFSMILSTLLILLVFRLIRKYVIQPCLLVRFYEKQGLTAYYTPLVGGMRRFTAAEKARDLLEPLKKQIVSNKKYKGTVGCVGSNCEVKLIGSNYLRDITQSPNFIKFPLRSSDTGAGPNLINLEGEKHKRLRKILSASFHYDFVISNIATITELCNTFFNEWAQKSSTGNYMGILGEIGQFTGESISAIFFGSSSKDDIIDGKRMTDVVSDLLIRNNTISSKSLRYPWYPFIFKLQIFEGHRKLRRDNAQYHAHCKQLLEKRKKEIIEQMNNNSVTTSMSKDLLYHLTKAQLNAKSDEERLTDREIFAQYLLFLTAGQETTSNLLSMIIYVLTQHPEHKISLLREIQKEIKDINQITYEETNNLVLLNAVIKETLRLYTPAYQEFPRLATKDTELGELKVKKGTVVSAYLTLGTWKHFKEPNLFKPERWNEGGEGKLAEANEPFGYLPFYAGPRNCLGQHFALLQTKIFLIHFISKFDFNLKPGYQLRMTSKFTYQPVDPVMIQLSLRNPK